VLSQATADDYITAADLKLLHKGGWLETTSVQPQSIFHPATPSAGCRFAFI